MKIILKYLGRCLLPILLITSVAAAQSHQGAYMQIEYVKVPADQIQSFNKQVESTFKPIQENRLQNNHIVQWGLYKVAYPGNQESPYNYVIITISESLSGFEDIPGQLSDGFSRKEKHLQNYQKHLNPNHTELWGVRNSVISEEGSNPTRYLRMNYMDVVLGHEYEYQMFEDEVAKPLHIDRMERNQMRGWELYELILPGGTDYGYNFSTADYYDQLENIEFGFNEELIRQNHPDTNLNDFFDNMYRTRDLVRIELWELVDYVN